MPLRKPGFAANELGVHITTVRKWVESGKLQNSHVDTDESGKKRYWIDQRDIDALLPSDGDRAEESVIVAVRKFEQRLKELQKAQKTFQNIVEQYRAELYKEKRENANQIDLTPILQDQRTQGEKLDKLEQDMSLLKSIPNEIQKLTNEISKMNTNVQSTPTEPVRKRISENPLNKFARR